MSIDNKKGVKRSQESSEDHRTGSTVAEPDTTIYQDHGHDERGATIPGFEPSSTEDFSQIGALFADEKSDMDLILEI